MIEVIEMIYEAYVKESKIIDKTDEEKSLDLVKSLIKTNINSIYFYKYF